METQGLISSNRYFIAEVGQVALAFSAQWVRDILVVERSQILHLPFYPPMFLGVIQVQSEIVPLVSAQKIWNDGHSTPLPATLTAVRLSQLAQTLTGVGIVVDRMVGSVSELNSQHKKFALDDIPTQIWQPQR